MGDATPFPIEGDYIEVIHQATEACLLLIKIDIALGRLQRNISSIRSACDSDIDSIELVGEKIHNMLAQKGSPEIPSYVDHVNSTIGRSALQIAEQAKGARIRQRDEAINEIGIREGHLRKRVLPLLERLLAVTSMPSATWELDWNKTTLAASRAHIKGLFFQDLFATFNVDIMRLGRWKNAPQISEFHPELSLSLPKRNCWRSRTNIVRRSVASFHITAVSAREDRGQFTITKHLGKNAPQYEITVFSSSSRIPEIKRVYANGERSDAIALDSVDTSTIKALWRAILDDLRPAIEARREMLSVSLRHHPYGGLDSPRQLVEMIVDDMAPHVREIYLRSPTPEELILKRNVMNDRREIRFLKMEPIRKKIASLPETYRHIFSMWGPCITGDSPLPDEAIWNVQISVDADRQDDQEIVHEISEPIHIQALEDDEQPEESEHTTRLRRHTDGFGTPAHGTPSIQAPKLPTVYDLEKIPLPSDGRRPPTVPYGIATSRPN